MTGTYNEQAVRVTGVFEQWGPCERTVVACALARRVPWPGLKLVQRAVEAALLNHGEDERLERDANDETLLANLLTTRNDLETHDGGECLQQLLTLLPLLRTDNERAKDVYVNAAPALVQRCLDAPQRTSDLEQCRQLLSYLLVHPALTHNDQRTLTQWLRYLESNMTNNRSTDSVWQQRVDSYLVQDNNIWGCTNTFRRTVGKNVEFRGLDSLDSGFSLDLLQESFSKNGRDVDISLEGDRLNFDAAISQPKSQRSNSLTPPGTNFIHMSSSAENLSDEPCVQKPRSFSLSSEHSLGRIRPIGITYGTTGSETRLDDLRSNNFAEHPGMSMVAQWLKSLRLHKYVWLFTNISYDQMMAMDEEYLEKLGVTKGARHKLLLSVKKLNERDSIVESVATELSEASTSGSIGRALERLRGVIVSPMPPVSDLPATVVRTLELASKCINSMSKGGLLSSGKTRLAPSDDSDLEHVDPLSLHCWLVEKALHHESFARPELAEALKRLRHRLPPRQFFHHVSDMPLHRRCTKGRWRLNPNGYPKPAKRWLQLNPVAGSAAPPPPRGKSHSYPPFPPAPRPPPADDYSSLDALCLQMTEQAIN